MSRLIEFIKRRPWEVAYFGNIAVGSILCSRDAAIYSPWRDTRFRVGAGIVGALYAALLPGIFPTYALVKTVKKQPFFYKLI